MPAADPAAAEARLRELALALPETGEKPTHGVPGFFVAGKLFAYFRHDHQGDGLTVACVRTSGRDEQEALLAADPKTYSRRAPSNWIAVNLADGADWALVAARLRASWRVVAPRGLTG